MKQLISWLLETAAYKKNIIYGKKIKINNERAAYN